MPTNPITLPYSEFVAKLKKSGDAICATMNPASADLLHMAVGVSSDAGELLDVVKKCVIYNQQLDLPHLVEEMGDIEFFLEGMRQQVGVSREEVIAANMTKLRARYDKLTYTDEDAKLRKDKCP